MGWELDIKGCISYFREDWPIAISSCFLYDLYHSPFTQKSFFFSPLIEDERMTCYSSYVNCVLHIPRSLCLKMADIDWILYVEKVTQHFTNDYKLLNFFGSCTGSYLNKWLLTLTALKTLICFISRLNLCYLCFTHLKSWVAVARRNTGMIPSLYAHTHCPRCLSVRTQQTRDVEPIAMLV